MASWDNQTSTPQVKFEDSPAESFVSTPGGDMYPSLFDDTMTPMESAMTPQSPDDDGMDDSGTPGPESSDKKQTKKRKSWGQVLPEPKTNLPPRKRAKTEDEKEQRRVERVLRNRRAAQFSRERKRQEVEALEKRNQELEALLHHHQTQNAMLMEELSKFRRSSGVMTRGSSPSLQPTPITLSQPLFGSDSKSGMMEDFILMDSRTVDPASLSPELTPVPDNAALSTSSAPVAPATASSTSVGTSNDVTQHPAVSVSRSAPVVDGLAPEVATGASNHASAPIPVDSLFGDAFSLSEPFEAHSWGLETQFSPSSNPLDYEYHHMDGDATSGLPDFDISQFLDDSIGGAAPGAIAGNVSVTQEFDSSFSFLDPENQISSETLNLQPQTGASSQGCDAGSIAVGV